MKYLNILYNKLYFIKIINAFDFFNNMCDQCCVKKSNIKYLRMYGVLLKKKLNNCKL
jgi:hypothetical protein